MERIDPKLEFYRGEGVEKFLKRYTLNDEEKRTVYRAIRMVKRRHRIDPKVIEEADRAVASIIREREPKVEIMEDIIQSNRGVFRILCHPSRPRLYHRSRYPSSLG
ncbi:hypothetical protein [Nitratifractor sp.]